MIRVIDEADILSKTEQEKLGRYVVECCKSNVRDVRWVKHIKIRDDGLTDYFGYWTVSLTTRPGGQSHKIETVIILNSRYLRTLAACKRVLAHEYGHNFTLGYLYYLERIQDHFKDTAPRLYYRIRRLGHNTVKPDYDKGWEHCDKEIMAEDYRTLFTKNKAPHRMKELFGNPSTEVDSYFKVLEKQKWQ